MDLDPGIQLRVELVSDAVQDLDQVGPRQFVVGSVSQLVDQLGMLVGNSLNVLQKLS